MRRNKKTGRKRNRKAVLGGLAVLSVVLIALSFFKNDVQPKVVDFISPQKHIHLSGKSAVAGVSVTHAKTVEEFMQDKEMIFDEDEIFPPLESTLHNGTTIVIQEKKSVRLQVEGEETLIESQLDTVQNLLYENNIELSLDDLVIPSPYSPITDGMEVQVIRVDIKEEVKLVNIDFETIQKKDDDMGWREEEIEQQGVKGSRQKTYRVVYHDEEEIDRDLIDDVVTKEPVDEILVKGTYVKLGKSHKGAASWYAHTGTMAAANPWLPMGSYVKVTNRDNGKSVIVKINDRGPFVAGRIIDLDKVAFEKIASIGAGVVDVKMEEIKN